MSKMCRSALASFRFLFEGAWVVGLVPQWGGRGLGAARLQLCSNSTTCCVTQTSVRNWTLRAAKRSSSSRMFSRTGVLLAHSSAQTRASSRCRSRKVSCVAHSSSRSLRRRADIPSNNSREPVLMPRTCTTAKRRCLRFREGPIRWPLDKYVKYPIVP